MNRCIRNTYVCYWYILKACSSTRQICNEWCSLTDVGDGCCANTEICRRNGINGWIRNTSVWKNTFWKQAVTNDRLVMDAVIILTLVEEMEWTDAFV